MLNFLKDKKKSSGFAKIVLSLVLIFTPVFANITLAPPVAASDFTKACNSESGALGWLLCPLVEFAKNTLEWFYNAAASNLVVKSSLFEDANGLPEVWGTFRNIANIVFIIVFLVVIISQLTGFGIDNYGIKRILPRLVVVAILVNLSFIVCRLAIDVSNILGASIVGLMDDIASKITPPAAGSGDLIINIAGIATIGFTIATGGIGPLLIILLCIVIGIICVAVLWLFSIIREIGIIVLVCLAPFAFVCYMLPNLESTFKKWLKMFEALLLIYPTCSLMVGSGKVLSLILFKSASGAAHSDIIQIAAMLAAILPFALIPFIVLSSLQALGKIGATVAAMGRRGVVGAYRATGQTAGRIGRIASKSEIGRSGIKLIGATRRRVIGNTILKKSGGAANRQRIQQNITEQKESWKNFKSTAKKTYGGTVSEVGQSIKTAVLSPVARSNERYLAENERRERVAKMATGETVADIMERQATARQNIEIKEEQARNATKDKGAVVNKLNELIDKLQSQSSNPTSPSYRTTEAQVIAAIRDINEKGGREDLLRFAYANSDKLSNSPRLINEMAGMSPIFKEFAKNQGLEENNPNRAANFADFINSGKLSAALIANGGAAYASFDKDDWKFVGGDANNPPHAAVIQPVSAGGAGPLAVSIANATEGKTIAAQVSYVQNLNAADRDAVVGQISAEQFTKLSNDMRAALAGVSRNAGESDADFYSRAANEVKTKFGAQITQINSDNRLKGRLSAADQSMYLGGGVPSP